MKEDKYKIEAKSTSVSDSSSATSGDIDYLPPKEIPDQELYHSHSWWTTYVFSQDAKYIGIQYALTAVGTGLLGLILSWLMRLQLAFPETFSGPSTNGFGTPIDWFLFFSFIISCPFTQFFCCELNCFDYLHISCTSANV